MIKNNLLLRTINQEKVERPPVWLMRQAGRILPEYREVRASVDGFVSLVKNPDLASEVTVQPVDILGVDAAILFSDILVIPECMGLPYKLIEKKGPYFPKTIENRGDIDRMGQGASAAEDLGYVYDAIVATLDKLDNRVPLIGFCGAPWTLFSYMIEGQGSKTFSKAKGMLYSNPKDSHVLLDKICDTLIAYLKLKIKAGVHVVQVFDSWAGLLNAELYEEFCIPYLSRIRESIDEVPVIFFSKGAYFALDQILALNPDVVGLDWTMQPDKFRFAYGKDAVVQGNLDPCVLYADPDTIKDKAIETINGFGGRHIFNLGHGVYPDTPKENVQHLVKVIQSYKYD